jgi:siroheme synthase-like protein
MSRYFPLFVDLTGKTVLLFGAGKIAARRLRGLVEFGAIVTVTAPEIGKDVRALAQSYPQQITLRERRYQPGEIAEAVLVLSAIADPEADRQIFEECRQKRIPVNLASDQTRCDFYFPALVQQDDLILGVSSGGTDHRKVRRVSAWLRRQLAEKKGEWE